MPRLRVPHASRQSVPKALLPPRDLFWLRRPAAVASLCCLHSPNAGARPFPRGLPLYVKGCLKLSQSSTRCLFPTPSLPWRETATVPPCPWDLQGAFCSPGHYRLVGHHWPHAAPPGSAMGKPVGDEAGAVQLHPAPSPNTGWVRRDSAPALCAAVLQPAGCQQKCLLGCCAATTETLTSFASQLRPGVEPAGVLPSSHRSRRAPGPTLGGFSHKEGTWVPHGHPNTLGRASSICEGHQASSWRVMKSLPTMWHSPCILLQNWEPRRW